MKWYWITLLFVCVVGWFGMFWVMPLSQAEWTININMTSDENTKDIVEAMERIDAREECEPCKVTCFEYDEFTYQYVAVK